MQIRNAKLVLEEAVLEDHVLLLEGGRIQGIVPRSDVPEGAFIDADGAYLLPGMIDIHADMIEGIVQPRTSALMDIDRALGEAEKILVSCGITTMFHSLSMHRLGVWDSKILRTAPMVKKLCAAIAARSRGATLLNSFFHLRYEIDNTECIDDVFAMVESGEVQLLSLMDHRPGQGQYGTAEAYKMSLSEAKRQSMSPEALDRFVAEEMAHTAIDAATQKKLVDCCSARGIAVSSHDDDSPRKIDENLHLGVAISEFPINLETARYAHEKGLYTLLGAPNIMLGGSHSGNLGALDAIAAGVGDILCSDYYPQALLQAVFRLVAEQVLPLHEAWKLVSLTPAKAVGLGDKLGSIVPGKQADFLLVRMHHNEPQLCSTWVKGQCVLDLRYLNREGA